MKRINKSVIHRVLHFLFAKINKRSAKILTIRFGLEEEKKQSLNKIGLFFGITRERVRQIELGSLSQLKKLNKNNDFNLIIDNVIEIIKKNGGLIREEILAEYLMPELNSIEENKLMFILRCSLKVEFYKSTLKNSSFWSLKEGINRKQVEQVNQFVINQLNEIKKSIKIKSIKKIIDNSEFKDIFRGQNGEKKLVMFLLISKELKRNLIGEWGLKNWSSVSELGNKEKAYLVLRKKQRPLHFKKITEYINFYWIKKKSLPQTVHNELIKDKRFVLVGRGTYGLIEWGMKGGTVKEIIFDLFKKENRFLLAEEIIEYVFTQKTVKKTTILVNLSNKEIFDKNKKGQYFLKDRHKFQKEL